jgi:hypothetical protein
VHLYLIDSIRMITIMALILRTSTYQIDEPQTKNLVQAHNDLTTFTFDQPRMVRLP